MKKILMLGTALLAAHLWADPATDELTAAAKKLGEKSYAWKTVTVVPESAQFKPGPVSGKTEKDAYTYVTMSFGENETEAYIKGPKAALTNQDGEWKLASELENEEGPGRFLSRMMSNFKAPGEQAAALAANLKDLKKDGDTFSGEMNAEALKTQFRFGEPKDAKGTAKFWVKDGLLAKFETKVTGKLDFGGNEVEIDRTATTEIKDVGVAKVTVPEAVKKKLN